jgi:uncharacterized membrane protein YhaH (DUF805 family)
MSFGQWYLRRGRIDRRTYWLHYFLPLFVVSLAVEIVALVLAWPTLSEAATAPAGTVDYPPVLIWLPLLVGLATIVPSVSSQVTRLHDRGHSAWWLLFNLLPLAGAIVLLVQMCLPGDAGPNIYGPPPGPRHPMPDAPRPAGQA